MKHTLRAFALLTIATVASFGQTILPDWRTVPTVIPTAAAAVVTSDRYPYQIVLSNTTGSAITVSISDRQQTPVPVLVVTVPAYTLQVVSFPGGYYCQGGITWSAAANGVTGYISGRQQ